MIVCPTCNKPVGWQASRNRIELPRWSDGFKFECPCCQSVFIKDKGRVEYSVFEYDKQ